MELPNIHSNGTSAEELIRLRCDVIDKLNEAYDALKQMAPNGRDYYVKPGSMEVSVVMHTRRMNTIDGLIVELDGEVEELDRIRNG